jgi:hypothetical protein
VIGIWCSGEGEVRNATQQYCDMDMDMDMDMEGCVHDVVSKGNGMVKRRIAALIAAIRDYMNQWSECMKVVK